MPPSLYRAYLNSVLAINGSESEVYVNTLQTLDGETLSFSYFSPFTRGILIVDPESQAGTQPEIISFTGIDATGIGFTGITRGLSSVTTGSVTANKVYHGTGTPVIISWGAQNISDLVTYVTSLVSGSLGSATDTTAGSTKLSANQAGSNSRAKATLVSQSGTGATNLLVNPFSLEYQGALYGNQPTTANPPVYSQTSTGAFSATTSTNRIDLVVWTTAASPGSVAIRTGIEGSTPSIPTPTPGDIVLACVYVRHGFTKVLERDDSTNAYIMNWYEPSVYATGSILNSQSTSSDVDQTQTTENTAFPVGEAVGVSGKHSIIGQSFIPALTSIAGVRLWKTADTGTFTGTVKVSLQATTAGSPSGTDLASYTITNAAWADLAAGVTFAVSFGTEYESLVVGNTYWIVVTTSTTDSSNHPNVGSDNVSAHGLTLKYYNSVDLWATAASTALYFQTLPGVISKIMETTSTGTTPLSVRPYSFVGSSGNVSVTNTTTETTVASFQVDGNFFQTTSGFHIRFVGSATQTGTGGTTNAKVYLGTAAFVTITTVLGLANVSGDSQASIADIYVVNNQSLSSQNVAYGFMAASTGGTATFGSAGGNVSTPTVDTSKAPDVIKVTFTNSTATNYASTLFSCILEKIG